MQKSISALKKDKRFAKLVKIHGVPDLKWGRVGLSNSFRALVRSIIYQQVSGSAASSILKKFISIFGRFPKPADVNKVSTVKFQKAGLSHQKTKYIKDLAKKFIDGTIKHRNLRKMSNVEVIEHLIQVKGIGEWSAHMFLIFTLNRPNILPTGDLGIQKGFKILYGLKSLPSPDKMERLAKPWREHASYASWYLWRVADNTKKKINNNAKSK